MTHDTDNLPTNDLLTQKDAFQWLCDVTVLPTAAGREDRVIAWIRDWVDARDAFTMHADDAGNLIIEHRDAPTDITPVYFTAHMDHPAFVVEEVDGSNVRLSFRGGVRDPYFKDAHVSVHTDGGVVDVQLSEAGQPDPFRDCRGTVVDGDAAALKVGDVGTWKLKPQEIDGDLIRTIACDDLAALVAAIAALEELHLRGEGRHVRILLTRAEEVGFIGAIAACREKTMTEGARVIALENSRSFADSPIGGGPIVRVGDRISTFSPSLTGAVAKVADQLHKAMEKDGGAFEWQRKLMPGGACEATVFQTFGYEATCVCLPLGNYHNMGNLEEVLDGDDDAAHIGREFISVRDFNGLVRLLTAVGVSLGDVEPVRTRLDNLWEKTKFVLE